MNEPIPEILTIQSLLIGYSSSKKTSPLLPPLNASASSGELVAILGRNGIGKSTLLRTIAGLQKPLGGSVMIRNEPAAGFSRLKLATTVGYISTETVKVSHMRVYDLAALGRFPHTNWIGHIDKEADKKIRESIDKAGLAGFGNRLVSELSDGERQRTMIARVLAQDTGILLMDEPMAFLDISGKYSIITLMKELTTGGKTIIFSTHDFNIAVNQADKIWLMNSCGILQGAPEDLQLGNDFDCLFDKNPSGFNPENGTFDQISSSRTQILIEGDDSRLRHFTTKALKRAGYDVTDKIITPKIKLPSGSSGWILSTGETTTDFKTLYDVVRHLKESFPAR